jgi:hypothetical protein
LFTHTELAANTKVRAAQTGNPPEGVEAIKDLHTNPRTRKQLIEGFWKRQKGITGQIAYVGNDTERERLRKAGKVMVLISDFSAQHVTIIAPATMFEHA